jgi:hypothetical protein
VVRLSQNYCFGLQRIDSQVSFFFTVLYQDKNYLQCNREIIVVLSSRQLNTCGSGGSSRALSPRLDSLGNELGVALGFIFNLILQVMVVCVELHNSIYDVSV